MSEPPQFRAYKRLQTKQGSSRQHRTYKAKTEATSNSQVTNLHSSEDE